MESIFLQTKPETVANEIIEKRNIKNSIIYTKALFNCLQQNKSLTASNLLFEIELLQSKTVLFKLKNKLSKLKINLF